LMRVFIINGISFIELIIWLRLHGFSSILRGEAGGSFGRIYDSHQYNRCVQGRRHRSEGM
jgi:hypothetical protein